MPLDVRMRRHNCGGWGTPTNVGVRGRRVGFVCQRASGWSDFDFRDKKTARDSGINECLNTVVKCLLWLCQVGDVKHICSPMSLFPLIKGSIIFAKGTHPTATHASAVHKEGVCVTGCGAGYRSLRAACRKEKDGGALCCCSLRPFPLFPSPSRFPD